MTAVLYANTGMTHEEWEQARHRAEVRMLLRMRHEQGKEHVQAHLAFIGKKRGLAAVRRIEDDCRVQWRLGNRGEGWVEP